MQRIEVTTGREVRSAIVLALALASQAVVSALAEAGTDKNNRFAVDSSCIVFDPRPSGHSACSTGLTIAPNGDILVTFGQDIGDWGTKGAKLGLIRSTDGGKSWGAPTWLTEPTTPPNSLCTELGIATTSSGAILLPYSMYHAVDGPSAEAYVRAHPGRFPVRKNLGLYVLKSLDNGHTWTNRKSIPFAGVEAFPYGRIVETKTGKLLCPLNGAYHEGEYFRSGLIESTDGGDTWGNYTTIAYTPATGYVCETSIVPLSGGRLLAITRNQGPHRLISTDDGRTWSPFNDQAIVKMVDWPASINTEASPCLNISPRGTLMLFYRTYDPATKKFDVAASWSTDEGRTWRGAIRLKDPLKLLPANNCNAYPAVANLPHGRILVTFHNIDTNGGQYLIANILRELD